jgi:hypothetical protein
LTFLSLKSVGNSEYQTPYTDVPEVPEVPDTQKRRELRELGNFRIF